jgi:hypothetical protein
LPTEPLKLTQKREEKKKKTKEEKKKKKEKGAVRFAKEREVGSVRIRSRGTEGLR